MVECESGSNEGVFVYYRIFEGCAAGGHDGDAGGLALSVAIDGLASLSIVAGGLRGFCMKLSSRDA